MPHRFSDFLTVDKVSGLNKANMFESGAGGYGYNAAYVGGTYYKDYGPDATGQEQYQIASLASEITHPSKTIMFADAALSTSGSTYQEYSFVEPPINPSTGTPGTTPTIHFRHNGIANVGWCDGHVSAEKMGVTPTCQLLRRQQQTGQPGFHRRWDQRSL